MNGAPPPTDWLPGLLAVSFALMAFGLYAFFTWGRPRAPTPAPSDDGPLADAERRSQKLLDQLKELTVERHQLSEAQFVAEKERLEQEAGQALRQRDQLRAAAPGIVSSAAASASPVATDASPTPTSPAAAWASAPATSPVQARAPASMGVFSRHPQLVGATWGAGLVLFFGLVAFVLNRAEKPRGKDGVMTGITPPGNEQLANTQQQTATPEDDLQPALVQLKSHPEDVELASRIAHELIRRRDFQKARDITNKSLGVDPFNAENLAHRAFLRAVFGDEKGASEELQHVADVYPESYEALLFLGMVQMGGGHNREALVTLERFMKEAPPQEYPPQLAQALAQLHQQAGVP